MKTVISNPRHAAQGKRKRDNISLSLFILFLIRIGLEVQNTAEKLLSRLRMHIEKLEGNALFPVTEPSLAELKDMVAKLQKDIDEIAGGNIALLAHRNNLEEKAVEMITHLSYHIQFLSKGDEVKIKSAGFDVHKPKSRAPLPGQVLKLSPKPVGPGKIKLKWKKEARSKFYMIEINADPLSNAPWQLIGKTSKVNYTVENLTPGQVYYFRVIASNGSVDANPSDIAEQRSL